MGLVMKNCNQSCGASAAIPYLVGWLAIPTHGAGHAPPQESAIRGHWHHAEWAVALAIVRHIGKPLPWTCPPPGPTRAGLRTAARACWPRKTPWPPFAWAPAMATACSSAMPSSAATACRFCCTTPRWSAPPTASKPWARRPAAPAATTAGAPCPAWTPPPCIPPPTPRPARGRGPPPPGRPPRGAPPAPLGRRRLASPRLRRRAAAHPGEPGALLHRQWLLFEPGDQTHAGPVGKDRPS